VSPFLKGAIVTVAEVVAGVLIAGLIIGVIARA
jgi:hypothetical protein